MLNTLRCVLFMILTKHLNLLYAYRSYEERYLNYTDTKPVIQFREVKMNEQSLPGDKGINLCWYLTITGIINGFFGINSFIVPVIKQPVTNVKDYTKIYSRL